MGTLALRPVKSCESLTSDTDTLAPLAERAVVPLKHHTRSSSCDSYFEPWQAELADMRLRLSPQERDRHMFSEEDDTQIVLQQGGDSLCSTPPESGLCSVDPSPRRNLRVDIEAANELAEKRRLVLEEQLSSLGYIDGESPRARPPPEKRHSARAEPPHTDRPKRLCKDRDSPKSSQIDFQTSPSNVKLRDRGSPRKSKNNRYSTLQPEANDKITTRLSWHGKDGHSTLIKIDWPNESTSNLTSSTLNSCPITPNTPNYDPLETDSESDNKQTIKVSDCANCEEGTCLKCELKAADYNRTDTSPINSDLSYKNLNRLSAVSTSSDEKLKVMTSSHESTSSYSNSHDYECCNFTRPSYINLSSSSKSSTSPLKSPLKSTISITFRSPTKSKDSDRDSVYEDIVLDKSLSIVEDATVPNADASLPTQQACQPDFNHDLIILESPTETHFDTIDDKDIYSQVKFFKKSIEEVNAMMYEDDKDKDVLEESVFLPDEYTDENSTEEFFKEEETRSKNESYDYHLLSDKNHYENIQFNDYENIDVDKLKLCDKLEITENTQPNKVIDEHDNGNVKKEKNLNVRELAIRFESPTEQKGPFTFEKFKAEVKYPSLERKPDIVRVSVKSDSKTIPKSYKLTKNSARSLDENAFVKEFGADRDRRKSLEVRDGKQIKQPDLNLNIEEKKATTPTTENKISLIQRFEKPEQLKPIITFDTEKKLSRERIEKYKEERRNFLREKYSSQSFRSSPEQLTRIKIKKDTKEELPKFERRNTVDLGQRMRFSLAKSANNLDTIQSPIQSPTEEIKGVGEENSRDYHRKEKMSPSLNIKDMAALFEKQNPTG